MDGPEGIARVKPCEAPAARVDTIVGASILPHHVAEARSLGGIYTFVYVIIWLTNIQQIHTIYIRLCMYELYIYTWCLDHLRSCNGIQQCNRVQWSIEFLEGPGSYMVLQSGRCFRVCT